MYNNKENVLREWTNELDIFFKHPQNSILSDKKIVHHPSLLDMYYKEQICLIKGITLSKYTRHFKNIRKELPSRKTIILFSILFKNNIKQTNLLLKKHYYHELYTYDLEDIIYSFMIQYNQYNNKYCVFFLFDELYQYIVSRQSIYEYIENDSFNSYNRQYLLVVLISFDKYLEEHSYKNNILSLEEAILKMKQTIYAFIEKNYSATFNKSSLTIANIIRFNLRLEVKDKYIEHRIHTYVKSLTDFRHISLSKVKEKFILIGFYIGMDIEEINMMLKSVGLSGLDANNIYHLPIIDLIKTINRINPFILPYTQQNKYSCTLEILKHEIENSISLSDVLLNFQFKFSDILVLGKLNNLYNHKY